jgi:hypothetical protein
MKKNKLKDNSIKSHQINSQKIKNLIHLNDLKKLKKYSMINSNSYDNYILRQNKLILKKLAKKYNRGIEFYRKKVISDIIDNETTHLVASFKEFLIYGDYSEFLQGYFHAREIKKFLPLIFDYYHSSTVIFPNYVILEEKKYIYKNIQKKQQIINVQQEQEEMENNKKKKEKEEEKLKLDDDDNINFDSDSTSKSEILTSHALNSILNQTNTSNNIKLFGLNKNSNTSEDLVKFIEKLNNEEKKVSIKNKSNSKIKNRNKHIISIHKGNNSKKENNKSNTNTYNTLSTKNNTKGKEKSNLDTKSFSDKNIKQNYNLSYLSLNHSKNINKNFLLKLDRMKRKRELKTTKNILIELSSLNTSRKFKKINFFYKKNKNSHILKEFNKSKMQIKDKKYNEKETIKNYNFRHIKRIKSCYGMNNSYSRNKKMYSENTVFAINSNKNINPYGFPNYKICSTLNNINTNITNNDNKLYSIEKDKKHKMSKKKNKIIIDNRTINMIYSKHLPTNSSSKNYMNESLKTSRNIYNKINHQSTLPNKNNNTLKSQKKIKYSNFSPNNSKLSNPFETRVSPSSTFRNTNKKILKFALLSPDNINSKFSTTKIIPKKQFKKNIQMNAKKLKIKKDIKNILNENKSSNKLLIRNIIDKNSKININNDYLTINVDKNHCINPIDMKKHINMMKIGHYRTRTLCNQLSAYYKKDKK